MNLIYGDNWGTCTRYLMCIGPCIVVIVEEENQPDATQYFIEL
jgi:hypothetical protein